MRLTVLVLGVVAVGCAASSEEEPGCKPRVGSYVLSYTLKSGDCGTPSDEIVQVDGTPTLSPNCTGGAWAQTELNCKTTGDTTCTFDDGRKLQEKGVCRWSADGATGTCETQVILTNADGTNYCSGLFETKFRRQ